MNHLHENAASGRSPELSLTCFVFFKFTVVLSAVCTTVVSFLFFFWSCMYISTVYKYYVFMHARFNAYI